MTKRVQAVRDGDTVGYSRTFLRSTGQMTGDAPFARGKVKALHRLGGETILAEIEWDRPDLPARVNVRNLSTVQAIALGE